MFCKNKVTNDDDRTIIYKKNDYYVCEENDLIILKPKLTKKTIIIDDIDKLNDFDLGNSKILECYINDKRPTKNKYASIMTDIYKLIADGTTIIKNTLLNIKTIKLTENGFHYNSELGISIQNTDANISFKEISNQCLKHKFSLNIEIKLKNNETVIFKI